MRESERRKRKPIVEYHPKHGYELCGAKNRRGGVCKLPVLPGRTRCRYHGGMTPIGIAAPAYKNGKYAQLPKRYGETFNEAINDPQLMDVRNQVALLEAREHELITRLSSGEHGDAWKRVRKAHQDILESIRLQATDPAESRQLFNDAMRVIDSSIRVGTADEGVWGELRENMERKAKLVEVHRKRQMSLSAYMTADQAMSFVLQMMVLARECFGRHQEELRRFSQGIHALTSSAGAINVASAIPGGIDTVDAEYVDS